MIAVLKQRRCYWLTNWWIELVNLAGAKVVITADQGIRGGKVIELKKTVVDAVTRCPLVTTILTAKRTGKPVVSSPFDVDLDEVTFKSLSLQLNR